MGNGKEETKDEGAKKVQMVRMADFINFM